MPLTRVEAARLRPPDGWRWNERPRLMETFDEDATYRSRWGSISIVDYQNLSLSAYQAALQAFAAWLLENCIECQLYQDRTVLFDRGPELRVPQTFYVRPIARQDWFDEVLNNPHNGTNWYALDHNTPLGSPAGSLVDQHGTALICAALHCRRAGIRLYEMDGGSYCPHHVGRCEAFIPGTGQYCGEPFPLNDTHMGCATHYPLISCSNCSTLTADIHLDGICNTCNSRRCPVCERISTRRLVVDERLGRGRVCAECVEEADRNPGRRREVYDAAVDAVTPDELLIENNTERPTRTISLEMELAEGAAPVIRELHREGLATHGTIHGYHHGAEYGESFCYMERDSSLGETGGELIFDRMRLDDPDEVDRLHRSIRIVRRHVREGAAVMDMRCGLHIHVDAHRFGIGHVRNLAMIFNYLEDPMFRMSAASYMRHRGMNYANRLDKQGFEDNRTFGLNFLSTNGHTHALNVGHYWSAVRNSCRCGAAMVGDHANCECNLGKCTFEFRIYNGTTNFRKVHAYSALSLSMVSFARLSDSLDLSDYPPMDFNPSAPITNELKANWTTRLTWMFQNLYFSEAERASMHYVIRNCQLNELGAEGLAALERVVYVPKNAPEQPLNANTRRGGGGSSPVNPLEQALRMPRFQWDEDSSPDYDDEPEW